MALDAVMKKAVEEVTGALKDYANQKGWNPDDYRILFRVNEGWGLLHVLFAVRQLPGPDKFSAWKEVREYIDKYKKNYQIKYLNLVTLAIRTFEQLGEGGLYAISPEYIDVKEILPAGASA